MKACGRAVPGGDRRRHLDARREARWRSDAERDTFHAAVDRARAVYRKLAAEAK